MPAGTSPQWENAVVSAEHVGVIPLCEECRRLWLPSDPDRWQAHWIDDGPDEKLVFTVLSARSASSARDAAPAGWQATAASANMPQRR
jgi:hypothetical protein